ncbi:hypothetical protein CEXT_234731 [Caerostris extrusa]|uniref:Uncharacterized protein n=1 Tax=Caerostris extrusa TaxID=172846 RepID=A0AAV4WBC7_CAEEX|nr:hypothetical protein CEXT_234731 [Caerostris extrusa]
MWMKHWKPRLRRICCFSTGIDKKTIKMKHHFSLLITDLCWCYFTKEIWIITTLDTSSTIFFAQRSYLYSESSMRIFSDKNIKKRKRSAKYHRGTSTMWMKHWKPPTPMDFAAFQLE